MGMGTQITLTFYFRQLGTLLIGSTWGPMLRTKESLLYFDNQSKIVKSRPDSEITDLNAFNQDHKIMNIKQGIEDYLLVYTVNGLQLIDIQNSKEDFKIY